jgi:hypothetical protein
MLYTNKQLTGFLLQSVSVMAQLFFAAIPFKNPTTGGAAREQFKNMILYG